jgi:conjugal transfer pilus assembly protein TraL
MEQNHILLNYLDRPVRFLYFTADEAFSLIGAFLLGGIINRPLSGLLIGMGIALGLNKLKKFNQDCNITQIFYWYMPTSKSAYHIFIPSYLREFLG